MRRPFPAHHNIGKRSSRPSDRFQRLPLIQDGRLRAVAVTSRERMPQLPDAAPLAEAAAEPKGYELLNWFGLFAPAAAQQSVVVPATMISIPIVGTIAASTVLVAGVPRKSIFVTSVALVPVATAAVLFSQALAPAVRAARPT